MITSYGFMYELQRGNVNLFALFFSLLAVWLMLRLPSSPWWPAIVLAVAINLKLYPAILLVLLFWRYRLRAVVPVVVTNVVLLLVAGPANLWRFLAWLTKTAPGPRIATFGEMGAVRDRRDPAGHDHVGSVVDRGAPLRRAGGAVAGDGDHR